MSSPLNPYAEPFFMTRAHTHLQLLPYYPLTYCCPPLFPLQTPNPTSRGIKGKKRRVSYPTSRPKKGPLSMSMKQQLQPGEQQSHAVVKWVPKQKKGLRQYGETQTTPFNVIRFPTDHHQQEISTITTMMIKNIPNQFQRCDLINFLSNHCCDENLKAVMHADPTKSEFDFVYLPMDFKKYWYSNRVANLGYAFVNFTTPIAAIRFFKKFHQEHWGVGKNNKTREITIAKVQGVEALVEHFKAKKFWCHTDEYLPAVSEPPCDGVRLPKLVTVGKRVGMPFGGLKKKVNYEGYVFRV